MPQNHCPECRRPRRPRDSCVELCHRDDPAQRPHVESSEDRKGRVCALHLSYIGAPFLTRWGGVSGTSEIICHAPQGTGRSSLTALCCHGG